MDGKESSDSPTKKKNDNVHESERENQFASFDAPAPESNKERSPGTSSSPKKDSPSSKGNAASPSEFPNVDEFPAEHKAESDDDDVTQYGNDDTEDLPPALADILSNPILSLQKEDEMPKTVDEPTAIPISRYGQNSPQTKEEEAKKSEKQAKNVTPPTKKAKPQKKSPDDIGAKKRQTKEKSVYGDDQASVMRKIKKKSVEKEAPSKRAKKKVVEPREKKTGEKDKKPPQEDVAAPSPTRHKKSGKRKMADGEKSAYMPAPTSTRKTKNKENVMFSAFKGAVGFSKKLLGRQTDVKESNPRNIGSNEKVPCLNKKNEESGRQTENDKNKRLTIPVYPVDLTEEAKKAVQKQPAICTDVFGYGADFPNWMLEASKTVEYTVQPECKVPIPKVYRSMIVYQVPVELRDLIDVGDVLCGFNNHSFTNRDDYVKLISEVINQEAPYTVRYTFYRTITIRRVPDNMVDRVVPVGFNVVRKGYDYLYSYVVFVPKCNIGMNIKSFNGKIFVSSIENGPSCIARKSLLVGDAILAIDEEVVCGLQATQDILSAACAKKKYVKMLVERSKTPFTMKQVKRALMTKRKDEDNPKMGGDLADLCEEQITKMNNSQNTPKGVYRDKNAKSYVPPKGGTNNGIKIADSSVELPISTDVNNFNFLKSTPPIKPAQANGSVMKSVMH